MQVKLNMISALANKAHIDRHANPNSLTIGSKFLPDITPEEIESFLEKFDSAYLDMINKKGNPGLQVFAIECNRPVGTCAVVPIANLTKEGKAGIFEMIRDFGKWYESRERVVLISKRICQLPILL